MAPFTIHARELREAPLRREAAGEASFAGESVW
jgi:hypothetical protein